MCCITIDSSSLLKNIFLSPMISNDIVIDLELVKKCAVYLANNLPGSVLFDATDDSILNVIKNDYSLIYDNGRIIYFNKIELYNRDKYNQKYPEWIAKKITKIVDDFFRNKVYNHEIELLSPIYA